MKITDVYTNAGKALKAADVTAPTLKVIESVTAETIGQGPAKPVAKFTDGTRLILNQYNAFEISQWYGDDTDKWVDKTVELYPATTTYQGSPVPCIRVRRPAASKAPTVPPPAQNRQPGLLDDVEPPPF